MDRNEPKRKSMCISEINKSISRANKNEQMWHGPFKATQKWNEIVSLFVNGMPVKTHRCHLQQYEDTFTAMEAVKWLHVALKSSGQFKTDISSKQVVQLLEKLMLAGVFEKVSAKKKNEKIQKFKCNGSVYRFKPSAHSNPIGYLASVPKSILGSTDLLELDASPSNRTFVKKFLSDIKLEAMKKQKKWMDIGEVWKSVIFGRLEALLEGVDIENMLESVITTYAAIAKNTAIAQEPVPSLEAQLGDAELAIPDLIHSAVLELARGSGKPDINRQYISYQSAVGYFQSHFTELLESHLKEMTVTIYLYSECVGNQSINDSRLTSYKFGKPIRKTASERSFQSLPADLHLTPEIYPPRQTLRSGQLACISGNTVLHMPLPPNMCFETAFTTEHPTTRIIHKKERYYHNYGMPPKLNKNNIQRSVDCLQPNKKHITGHYRSASGGYINLALSESPNDTLTDDIDIASAIKSIDNLIEHSKETQRKRETSYMTAHSDPQDWMNGNPTNDFSTFQANAGISSSHAKGVAYESLQLLFLLMPPIKRKKLCLLLTFMDILSKNDNVIFSITKTNQEMVVNLFKNCIMKSDVNTSNCSEICDDDLSKQIITFLMVEREQILCLPQDLIEEVSHYMAQYGLKMHSLPSTRSCLDPLPTSLPASRTSTLSRSTPLLPPSPSSTVSHPVAIAPQIIPHVLVPSILVPTSLAQPMVNQAPSGVGQTQPLMFQSGTVLNQPQLSVSHARSASIPTQSFGNNPVVTSSSMTQLQPAITQPLVIQTAQSSVVPTQSVLLGQVVQVLSSPASYQPLLEPVWYVNNVVKDNDISTSSENQNPCSAPLPKPTTSHLHTSETVKELQNYNSLNRPHIRTVSRRKSFAESRVLSSKDVGNIQNKVAYCERVSSQEFEQQKSRGSVDALKELLEQIINNPKMNTKDKLKRIEQFKTQYPHIYKERFPDSNCEARFRGSYENAFQRLRKRFKQIRL